MRFLRMVFTVQGGMQYEMCMGRHPFTAQNEGALIRKILRGVYSPPTGYSSALLQLVQACLTFDQRKRPDTAALLKRPDVTAKARELHIHLDASTDVDAARIAALPPQQLPTQVIAAVSEPRVHVAGRPREEARGALSNAVAARAVASAEDNARALPHSHPFRPPAGHAAAALVPTVVGQPPQSAELLRARADMHGCEPEAALLPTAGVPGTRRSGQPFAVDAAAASVVRARRPAVPLLKGCLVSIESRCLPDTCRRLQCFVDSGQDGAAGQDCSGRAERRPRQLYGARGA